MLDRLDETIVAISSAPGHGVLGIVRLSGPNALSIADRGAILGSAGPLSAQPGFTRSTGEFFFDDNLSVPATCYIFRTPKSYTRQDLVEIHTLGSPSLLELVRQRLLSWGAVSAMPGEFTARAFLNGALDLASAEAVSGIIRAQSDTQLRAARRMMDGALARHITEARDELAELLALVEAEIDFAEEPIDFITPGQLHRRLGVLSDRLQRLMAGAGVSERLDQLPRILLFGRPNAGKSSLMNRLSGTRRSICAAAAGTTRDILSAPVVVGRGEALLLDTAGIDGSDDEIIAMARQKAFDATQQVDLVCVVLDATIPEDEQLTAAMAALESARWITAINKCDRLSDSAAAALLERVARRTGRPVALVSALEGRGIDTLRDVLAQALGTTQQSTASEAVLMTQRQSAAMSEAIDAIRRTEALCAVAADTMDCADLAAFELREALETLGAVTGAVTTEDLLGQVFARFCIGK